MTTWRFERIRIRIRIRIRTRISPTAQPHARWGSHIAGLTPSPPLRSDVRLVRASNLSSLSREPSVGPA